MGDYVHGGMSYTCVRKVVQPVADTIALRHAHLYYISDPRTERRRITWIDETTAVRCRRPGCY